MKCSYCGYESDRAFSYCPECGAQMMAPSPVQGSAQTVVLSILKDTLFLVLCVLVSISCAMSFIGGGLPVLEILFTVFLWLTYTQSRKDQVDVKHLRALSGTVYAQYVISYVIAGILVVVGLICAALLGGLSQTELMGVFTDSLAGYADTFDKLLPALASISGGLVMVVMLFAAVILVVINIFSLRYIHRFAKSVYQSVENGTLALKHTQAASVWLFIFGGFSGINALSSLSEGDLLIAIGTGAGCGAAIIAGILIRKYLTAEQ